MAADFPDRAEVVIIGGGIAGCSVAYHLTKIGITDVVLCERQQLTSGTTWHAAGLVTQLRATRRMTELAKYTGELFGTLEAETGQATGFKRRGSLRVANTPARYEELARGASMGRNFGLPVEPVSPGEIKERWSPISTEGIVGGFWFPQDGQVNPADVTQAYAKGARMGGARIFEHTAVTQILVENGKAAGVMTDKGPIRAEHRRHLRRHVVARSGGEDRRHPAAACGRAFLHRHRTRRRAAARSARAVSRRRMDLLQGRRGQAAGRLLRAERQALGPERASPTTSPSAPCPKTSTTSPRFWRPPPAASRCWSGPASSCSSTAPKASRPTTAICWAKRPRCRACSAPPASIPSASCRPAGSARHWPTGSATAARRWN